MAALLRSSGVRRILAAYTINRLGSWIGLIALSIAVYDHTHDSLAVAATLLTWQALPAFAVPALVARVEASERRGELAGLYVFEGVVTALLALAVWHFWLPAILVLTALDGTAALAAGALLRAAIARTAREVATAGVAAGEPGEADGSGEERAQEAERTANAALNASFSISFVGGPVIGGLVVAAAGAPVALLIDVASFLIGGALLIHVRPHVEEAGGDSVRARLRVAWQYVGETRTLQTLLIAQTAALVLIQAAAPIEVSFAKSTLNGGDSGYGLLVTSWGAGAVVASIVFARASRPRLGLTLSAGTLALGAAFIGFSVAPSLGVAYLAAFVGGFGNGLNLPSLISLVQRLTPARLHGRVLGGVESVMSLTLAAGLPLGGALVALGSPRVAFLTLGAGTAAVAIAFVRLVHDAGESASTGSLDPAVAGKSSSS